MLYSVAVPTFGRCLPFCSASGTPGAMAAHTWRGYSMERGILLRDPNNRLYEMMIIITPDAGDEELPKVMQAINGYIDAEAGTMLKVSVESPWGRRRLAYPIRFESRDVRDGYYALHYFWMNPDRISSLEREIGLNERIMRHLLLQHDEMPPSLLQLLEPEPEDDEDDAPPAAPAAPVAAAAEQAAEAAIADLGTAADDSVEENENPIAEAATEEAAAPAEAGEDAGEEA